MQFGHKYLSMPDDIARVLKCNFINIIWYGNLQVEITRPPAAVNKSLSDNDNNAMIFTVLPNTVHCI